MAGPGFRDFSRIAAGDPAVWRDILSANRAEVLAQLGQFQSALHELQKSIENNDLQALHRLIDQASLARSNWRLSPGDTSEAN
jgi:prephenate dehydrogenase